MMADNFLERHQLDYERRKAEWLRKKKTSAYIETPLYFIAKRLMTIEI